MQFRKQFRILNRLYGFSVMFRSRKFTGQKVFGFANKTLDNKYVIFLDYDNGTIEDVISILLELKREFHLSSFYIFKTNNGYHCICFDKVGIDRFLAILNVSYCCEDFRKTPLLFGHNQWSLRLTEKDGQKPKFIYRLRSEHSKYEKSSAHISLIEKLYGIEIDKANSDGEKELIGCKYPV